MITANNKISVIVEDQLPAFVRDDHNNFVQFVKSYYEFLELVNPPVDIPLRLDNPDENIYRVDNYNPYGAGPFIVGEVIEQRANDTDPTDVTASATVFAYNANTTSKIVTVTDIGGSRGKFVPNREIRGTESGNNALYWPTATVEPSPVGALQASYDLSNIRDLDLMTTQYLEFIQREIASGFPTNFADGIDKRTALKNLRDFYQSKGTENSFKLLFRLVFNEDIELYLPSEDMLRASVGEWEERTTLRLEVPTTDALTDESRTVSDIIGQQVTGESSGATAVIERAQSIVYAGATFVEADISSKVGTFEALESVRIAYIKAETNLPVTIRLTNYGLISSIDVVDGGSNYVVGDRVSVGGSGGVGTIARVSEIDDETGAVKAIEIVDPGYRYTALPTTLNLDGPHSGDDGAQRFLEGQLETLLDVDLNRFGGNNFFAESDNRGAYANTGAVGFDIYEIGGATIADPSQTTKHSYGNFVTVPGEKEGLQAWWRFDSYNIVGDKKINTLDGTFGDGNDPTANLGVDFVRGYWGPRVSDSVYRPDFRVPAFGYGNLDPLKTKTFPSANALSSNTYDSTGWVGFKPIVLDQSGNDNHAWLQTSNTLPFDAGFTGRANVITTGAFSQYGIYGSSANSWVNGPDQDDQKSLGGVVLRAHDDLRNANTQTWVLWYYPYGELGYFGGTYNNDTAWAQFDSQAAEFDANSAPNILSRDGDAYWSLQSNVTSVTSTAPYHDVIFRFQGGTWDNGNAANGQIANTSGLFPGDVSGTLNAGGGSLRGQTWNMIAMSLDYTAGVGNLYFFNTTDGFHSSNGFAISPTVDSNTTFAGGWPSFEGNNSDDYIVEGRGVVLGARSHSANGDSNRLEQDPVSSAHGRFDEVRYYDKALNQQQIAHLFKNPGGRFDRTLAGNWAIVNPASSTFTADNPVVGYAYDLTEGGATTIESVDTSGGLQVVYNESVPFDPNAHYKLSVRAKNSLASGGANVQFGVIGLANTDTRLLGYDQSDDWENIQPIAQSGDFGTTAWVTKTAVFGGNTSQSGWEAQGSGEGTYDWNNPAKLFGSTAATATTGNTAFFRPVLRWNDYDVAGETTTIQSVKVEAQRPATLSATLAGEFVWPGESTGDAGKLSTSLTNLWTPRYLSDNSFYQAYSYVIRSGLSINRYRDIVERLVHTSGKRLFGEVDFTTQVTVTPTASAFVGSVLRLFVDFYAGSESLLFGDEEPWDSRTLKGDVAIKSDFGLYDLPDLPFDLDLAHGEFDYSYEADEAVDGDDYTYLTPEGPAWIAWDQSPADNPYAKSHYRTALLPDPQYASSNTATRPTKDTLIWEVSGAYAKLVTGYEDSSSDLLALDGHYNNAEDNNDGVNWQSRQGLPLNIDSSTYRYVRMKVRRIGPGGYDDNDWIGACQAETRGAEYGNIGANYNRVEIGGTNIGANTISQPATLMVPAGSSADSKSPWHILEWDMHQVGSGVVGANTIVSDTFAANNIGWLGFTLTGNPTEDTEKFEIDWIQVDDGTKYPRANGSVWPIGRTANSNQLVELLGVRTQQNEGSGVGGYANTVKVNSSWDYSTRPMGEFSAAVSTPQGSEIKFANTSSNNATVIYASLSATKHWINASTPTVSPSSTEPHVLRASANTANATDWIVSTQLYANNDFDRYSLLSQPDQAQNWTPVTLELDSNDTLFLGHLYHEDVINPGTSYFADPQDQRDSDPRPFILQHYQPTGNVAPAGVVGGNTGHNFFGVSNTFNSELVLYGNTAGDGFEILSNGPRGLEEGSALGTLLSREHLTGVDTMLDYRGFLYMVGRGSDNVLLTKPAPGKSRDGTDAEVLPLILGEDPVVFDVPYTDGLGVVRTGPDRSPTIGVQHFEVANSLTLDSSGTALGEWRPHAIIEGPKGSMFVACNNYSMGSDTVYCYHIVPTQNVATGDVTAINVYPVYANTAHTSDIFQGCTGMAIDNLDPPNFYYATANTIFKIEPKGYSYETGDTTITQLVNSESSFWDTNYGTGTDYPPLGGYHSTAVGDPATYPLSSNEFLMEGTYGEMKTDRYNRLFFRGRSNVYVYDTSNNVLSVAYAPQENQTEIDTLTLVDASYDRTTIFDFDVEPENGELVFLVGTDVDGDAILGSVRPNGNLSYTIADGGQLVQTVIDPALTTTLHYSPMPSGIGTLGRFATNSAGKVRIRKRKDDGSAD